VKWRAMAQCCEVACYAVKWRAMAQCCEVACYAVKWRAMAQCWKAIAVYFSPSVSSVFGKSKKPISSSQTCPLEALSVKIENSYQTFIEKSTSHVKLFIHDTNKCTYDIYSYSNAIHHR
jgi:hypothetical protein